MKRTRRWAVFLFLVSFPSFDLSLHAQAAVPEPSSKPYGSRNTFGITAAYSNDSSHILLGRADNVKLGAIGLQYQRRLIANRYLVGSYAAEFRPVMLESNPATIFVDVQTSPVQTTSVGAPELTVKCVTGSRAYSFPSTNSAGTTLSGILYERCGRETTYAEGLSPVGFRINLRPQSRLQPTFSTYEGYIFSTKPLPLANAGSFNFSFEFGAGLEYYASPKTSVRLEYQVQHYSNGYSATANPGVDSGLWKLTYSFGR